MHSQRLGVLAICLALLRATAALPSPGKLVYDLPAKEADALSHIVEDDPADVFDDYVPLKKGKGSRSVEVSTPRGLERRKDDKQDSPTFTKMFQVALPIPPQKQPRFTVKNPINGNNINYYEINIRPFEQQVYPNLPKPAALTGYDGIAPGPTFVVPRGTETIVRFINEAKQASSIHLHGSPSRAPWDGWAEDITKPGEFKDYYFPNQQSARTLWYHDHAMHLTAENAYNGQAGAYIITDEAAEAGLGIPSGYGVYDIPLFIASKFYKKDGSLVSTNGEKDSFWGDVIHVNGQPWPFMNVEPRKYRFRLCDVSVSRSYALYFALTTATSKGLPFKVVASDAGLLGKSVDTSQLFLSMGERYEIVFDFTSYKGKTIELRNQKEVGGAGTDEDYLNTDKVMRFVVGNTAKEPDSTPVKTDLRQVPWPPADPGKIDHKFRFHRSNGEWQINGVVFSDVKNRMLANVPTGTVEVWELENSSGGWSHPIHIHLIDFKVLSRDGKRGVQNYEAAGLKDVVWLGRGETVRVEAHYSPWPGVYMFHCHNLIHEDNDMMAAFNTTVLPNYGYNATRLVDPMTKEWLAKPYKSGDLSARSGDFSDDSIKSRINDIASVDPYGHREE